MTDIIHIIPTYVPAQSLTHTIWTGGHDQYQWVRLYLVTQVVMFWLYVYVCSLIPVKVSQGHIRQETQTALSRQQNKSPHQKKQA